MPGLVSDPDDPDLDEPGPVYRQPKEQPMTEQPTPHPAEAERKPFVLNRDIQVAGVAHTAGETVMLTEEEHGVLEPMGVFEGTEPKSREDLQKDHEALVEAQKARIEEGPGVPEGEDEPKEETENEKAEREAKEQTDPNVGLRPPVPIPPRSA
jgi:hypothetical protein